MKKTNFLISGIIVIALFFGSCGNSTEKKTEQKDTTVSKTENTTVATEPDYSGTYSIVDKTVCELTILIQKNGNDLTYKLDNTEGKVEIIKQDSDVYLKLVAVNGASPKGDVEAKYENETLLIQNEGNAMNQYTNFKKCDAKYLELKKTK